MSVEVPRNHWGQPLIIPPGGGKPVPYQRASSFGDVLDDKSNLEKYLRRKVMRGLANRPDLLLAAATTPDEEKGALNRIAEDAIEAAGGSEKATIGTSLHRLTELLDAGADLPPYPQQYDADLVAYRAATEPFEHVAIERFVVNDELRVAGTPDRVSWHTAPLQFEGLTLPPALRIGDLKTGGHAAYLGKYAVQLAIYSRSQFYDPETGTRTPIFGWDDEAENWRDVDQDWGVIFHAEAGTGTCNLYALDLQAGWEGALLAADVRAWRKRKGLAVIEQHEQEVAA